MTYVDLPDEDDQVYYRQFNGTAWEGRIRLTCTDSHTAYPSSAVDPDGGLHVIWGDWRHGSSEIYYRMREPGEMAWIDEVPVTEADRETVVAVTNPVQTSAPIKVSLTSAAGVELSVHDILGRRVWKQDLGWMPAGSHQVTWNGTDALGHRASPGVYFIRITTETHTASAKIIVLR